MAATVGFCVVQRGVGADAATGVEFRVLGTGSEAFPLVRVCQDERGAAVIMGRLYYQTERLQEVPEERRATCRGDDAALALECYRARGVEGLQQLEGDFAVVIHDVSAQRLIALRDPLGGYPLYFTQQSGMTAIGTHMPAVAEFLPAREPDPEYLAEFIMLPCGREELPIDRTAIKGVSRVRSGSMLTLDLRTGRIEQRAWWNWLEQLPQVSGSSEDIARQYLALLRTAVNERSVGRVAPHLSGGMDSTAIALLARDCAREAGREPVHSLSLVYEKLALPRQERPFLESALQDAGEAMVVHRIVADDVLDFDFLQRAPFHDEPWPWIVRIGTAEALMREAIAVGANTVMSGGGADETLDTAPVYMADLFKRGRWIAAWREASRFAAGDNCGRWSIFRNSLFPFITPTWLVGGIGVALRGGYAPWRKQGGHTIAPWIRPEFAKRYGLRGRALANVRRMRTAGPTMSSSMEIGALDARHGDLCRWHLGTPHGVHLTHPFLDPRVVRFAMAIPEHIKITPEQRKPVLVEATKGLLPDLIRLRKRKIHFGEVYGLGLSRNLNSVMTMIEQSPIEDLGMIDKGMLADCMQQCALGAVIHARPLDRVNFTLAVIKWLSMWNQWPAAPSPGRVLTLGAAATTAKA